MFVTGLAACKIRSASGSCVRPSRQARRPFLLAAFFATATLLPGCGLLGDETDATGSYRFENSYGYFETVVLQPDTWKELRFSVTGEVVVEDADGVISGSGTCTRTSINIQHPDGEETRTDHTEQASVSGTRSGSRVTEFRISGCAYPRAMFGKLERGRIVLDTDLDFPVSRGTTVISDRFGDPSSLVMNRSDQ